MTIFAFLQEPANYTLDLIKNIYEPRGVEYGFMQERSNASDNEVRRIKDLTAIWHALKSHDAFIINGYTDRMCLTILWLNILFFHKPMAIDSDTELRIPLKFTKKLLKKLWLGFLFSRKYCYGFAGGNYGHKELFRYYGMTEDRIFVAPMMVDNEQYYRNCEITRHDPFRFCYLGRLIALKQIDRIVEALPSGCELHIIGDGEERDRIKSLALNKRIVFHGKVYGEKKIELLHSVDCLVLYSYYESWGLVINEALASGIPVIVSDKVGAKKDLVEGDSPTGLVAKWDDLNDLFEKMQCMAANVKLWKQCSTNAVMRMKNWDYGFYGKNFDSWRMIIEKTYENC